METKYEFLSHTADIKFKAFGRTLDEAFENSILAISSFLSKEQKIKPAKGKKINISGTDKESLFYNLLEEILVLLDTENFLTAKANLTVLGNTIKGEFFGDDASHYQGLDHIKSPTYAEMQLNQTKTGWELQAVMDV